MTMDQIIPNLFLGDLSCATNTAYLRKHNVHSVLTAMSGNVSVHKVRTSIPTPRRSVATEESF